MLLRLLSATIPDRPGRDKSDQVIRENPANRGTEASAEFLVGPPWRMESNAGLSDQVIRENPASRGAEASASKYKTKEDHRRL